MYCLQIMEFKMRPVNGLLTCWISIILFGFVYGNLDRACSKPLTEQEISDINISELIQKIVNESSTTKRSLYAYHLMLRIGQMPSDELDEKTITDIAVLLEDRDDSVRAWIAASLGVIGPKAKKAIPALEKALNKIKCSPGSLTSESSIRMALVKMGQNPSAAECPSIE